MDDDLLVPDGLVGDFSDLPAPVSTQPILQVVDGVLPFGLPTEIIRPLSGTLNLGPTVFTGPVSVALVSPPPAPAVFGDSLALNSLSVVDGLQTDALFVGPETSCYLAPTGSYVGDLTVNGRLRGPTGSVQVDRLFVADGDNKPWAYIARTGSFVQDLTVYGTLYGPSGAYQTMGDTGPAGPTGADSTVPGPAGPTGADSTVAGPAGPTGADSTVAGPTGATGADSTVAGPAGPTGADSTVAGLTGATGAASTVAGPTGPTGADSTVAGPAGPTGADSTVAGPTGATGAASTVAGPTGATGAASTVAGPTGATGAASTVAGPTEATGVLTVATTPNSAADPALNITATLASQALSINYTNLFNKLATYVTSSSLTTTLASYLTTSAATSTYAPLNARPWVAGYVWNNGASVTNTGVGQYNATSSRTSTGVYVLSFPTAAPKSASNVTCIWSPNTSGNFLVAMNNGNTASTATVMLRDSTNTAVEGIASFVIWVAP